MAEEKTIIDFMKLVSPGTSLRTVINDINGSNLGALIVFEPEEGNALYEGGFRVNCRFTPQRLFELCKMDGAVIISKDLKRILYANVTLTPDVSINTHETGTRHKAAERTARGSETFVIAISERKHKTTLFYKKQKYFLRSTEDILNEVSSSLQVLEKQRDAFNDLLSKLSLLEISGMVSVGDVCKILQRGEIMTKISESMKKSFIELGREGAVMSMRYRELIRGTEKKEESVLRDYLDMPLKRANTLLENLTYDGLLELESIARLIFERTLEEQAQTKGYRFLSKLPLSHEEMSKIVEKFGNLDSVLEANSNDFEEVVGKRAESLKEEIDTLREQILEGKVEF
jgi:diadenylate cyclase